MPAEHTQRIKIIKPGHQHGDKEVAVGTVLGDIDAKTAAHLIALGVAEPVDKSGPKGGDR
jgi:hypothetical protein